MPFFWFICYIYIYIIFRKISVLQCIAEYGVVETFRNGLPPCRRNERTLGFDQIIIILFFLNFLYVFFFFFRLLAPLLMMLLLCVDEYSMRKNGDVLTPRNAPFVVMSRNDSLILWSSCSFVSLFFSFLTMFSSQERYARPSGQSEELQVGCVILLVLTVSAVFIPLHIYSGRHFVNIAYKFVFLFKLGEIIAIIIIIIIF